MRSERHLVIFLAARFVVPVVIGALVFIYSSTPYADKVAPPMRLAATGIGLVFGYYLLDHLPQEPGGPPPESIRKAWSGRPRPAADLRRVRAWPSSPPCSAWRARSALPPVPLAEELTLTVAELSYLQERRKAYENLGKRTGLATVKSVVTSLIQSERYGTPLGTALRVLPRKTAIPACRRPRRRPPPCRPS